MKKKKKSELTSETLTTTLWDSIQDLRAGTIKVDRANAISTASREICRVKKLQLEVAKQLGKVTKAEAKRIMV